MTWTKLGDEYGDQGWKLSDAAFRLHTEALVWSNRKHLDGRLNKDEIRLWAKRPEAAAELVRQGFWADEDDHYLIVAHLGWQRTAAEWLRQSEVNKANRAKGKSRPVKPKPADEPSDESSDDLSDEWDRTGQDRKNAFKGSGKVPDKSEFTHCRYCDTPLRESQHSQHSRGWCNRPGCISSAAEEMAG